MINIFYFGVARVSDSPIMAWRSQPPEEALHSIRAHISDVLQSLQEEACRFDKRGGGWHREESSPVPRNSSLHGNRGSPITTKLGQLRDEHPRLDAMYRRDRYNAGEMWGCNCCSLTANCAARRCVGGRDFVSCKCGGVGSSLRDTVYRWDHSCDGVGIEFAKRKPKYALRCACHGDVSAAPDGRRCACNGAGDCCDGVPCSVHGIDGYYCTSSAGFGPELAIHCFGASHLPRVLDNFCPRREPGLCSSGQGLAMSDPMPPHAAQRWHSRPSPLCRRPYCNNRVGGCRGRRCAENSSNCYATGLTCGRAAGRREQEYSEDVDAASQPMHRPFSSLTCASSANGFGNAGGEPDFPQRFAANPMARRGTEMQRRSRHVTPRHDCGCSCRYGCESCAERRYTYIDHWNCARPEVALPSVHGRQIRQRSLSHGRRDSSCCSGRSDLEF